MYLLMSHDTTEELTTVEKRQRYALPCCSPAYCAIMEVRRSHEVIDTYHGQVNNTCWRRDYPAHRWLGDLCHRREGAYRWLFSGFYVPFWPVIPYPFGIWCEHQITIILSARLVCNMRSSIPRTKFEFKKTKYAQPAAQSSPPWAT